MVTLRWLAGFKWMVLAKHIARETSMWTDSLSKSKRYEKFDLAVRAELELMAVEWVEMWNAGSKDGNAAGGGGGGGVGGVAGGGAPISVNVDLMPLVEQVKGALEKIGEEKKKEKKKKEAMSEVIDDLDWADFKKAWFKEEIHCQSKEERLVSKLTTQCENLRVKFKKGVQVEEELIF